MAPDVFISYSQGDELVAERVRGFLEANGLSCWIASQDIPEGQDFGAAIAAAIRSCRVVVLVFSSRANTSKQIGRELKLADDASRIVVPLRIEDVPASGNFAYFLGAAQWIEAVGGPKEEDLQRLSDTLANPCRSAGKCRSSIQTFDFARCATSSSHCRRARDRDGRAG